MGLLDKAKAAASDLAAKADSAMTSMSTTGTGAPRPADLDKYFRDLGVLAYLEATGRPADAAERDRVMTTLRDLDGQGAIRSFALATTPPPAPGMAGPAMAPPPPGMAGATPPPAPGMAGATPAPPAPMGAPGGMTPPPAPAAPAEVAPPTPEPPAEPQAPPPPPSWA